MTSPRDTERAALQELAHSIKKLGLEIFDGPECPQAVRDAIEWFASELSVSELPTRAASPIAAQPEQTDALTDAQILKDSAEKVRQWLGSGCKGEPPRMESALLASVADAVLRARPAGREPVAIVTTIPDSGHPWIERLPGARLKKGDKLYTAPIPAPEPRSPRIWRHGNGVVSTGSIRVLREDFDTNPSPEVKTKMLDWICDALNAAEMREKNAAAQPDHAALLKDAARYRFLRAQAIDGAPGVPVIAVPNGMRSGYYLNEETADFAIDAALGGAA